MSPWYLSNYSNYHNYNINPFKWKYFVPLSLMTSCLGLIIFFIKYIFREASNWRNSSEEQNKSVNSDDESFAQIRHNRNYLHGQFQKVDAEIACSTLDDPSRLFGPLRVCDGNITEELAHSIRVTDAWLNAQNMADVFLGPLINMGQGVESKISYEINSSNDYEDNIFNILNDDHKSSNHDLTETSERGQKNNIFYTPFKDSKISYDESVKVKKNIDFTIQKDKTEVDCAIIALLENVNDNIMSRDRKSVPINNIIEDNSYEIFKVMLEMPNESTSEYSMSASQQIRTNNNSNLNLAKLSERQTIHTKPHILMKKNSTFCEFHTYNQTIYKRNFIQNVNNKSVDINKLTTEQPINVETEKTKKRPEIKSIQLYENDKIPRVFLNPCISINNSVKEFYNFLYTCDDLSSRTISMNIMLNDIQKLLMIQLSPSKISADVKKSTKFNKNDSYMALTIIRNILEYVNHNKNNDLFKNAHDHCEDNLPYTQVAQSGLFIGENSKNQKQSCIIREPVLVNVKKYSDMSNIPMTYDDTSENLHLQSKCFVKTDSKGGTVISEHNNIQTIMSINENVANNINNSKMAVTSHIPLINNETGDCNKWHNRAYNNFNRIDDRSITRSIKSVNYRKACISHDSDGFGDLSSTEHVKAYPDNTCPATNSGHCDGNDSLNEFITVSHIPQNAENAEKDQFKISTLSNNDSSNSKHYKQIVSMEHSEKKLNTLSPTIISKHQKIDNEKNNLVETIKSTEKISSVPKYPIPKSEYFAQANKEIDRITDFKSKIIPKTTKEILNRSKENIKNIKSLYRGSLQTKKCNQTYLPNNIKVGLQNKNLVKMSSPRTKAFDNIAAKVCTHLVIPKMGTNPDSFTVTNSKGTKVRAVELANNKAVLIDGAKSIEGVNNSAFINLSAIKLESISIDGWKSDSLPKMHKLNNMNTIPTTSKLLSIGVNQLQCNTQKNIISAAKLKAKQSKDQDLELKPKHRFQNKESAITLTYQSKTTSNLGAGSLSRHRCSLFNETSGIMSNTTEIEQKKIKSELHFDPSNPLNNIVLPLNPVYKTKQPNKRKRKKFVKKELDDSEESSRLSATEDDAKFNPISLIERTKLLRKCPGSPKMKRSGIIVRKESLRIGRAELMKMVERLINELTQDCKKKNIVSKLTLNKMKSISICGFKRPKALTFIESPTIIETKKRDTNDANVQTANVDIFPKAVKKLSCDTETIRNRQRRLKEIKDAMEHDLELKLNSRDRSSVDSAITLTNQSFSTIDDISIYKSRWDAESFISESRCPLFTEIDDLSFMGTWRVEWGSMDRDWSFLVLYGHVKVTICFDTDAVVVSYDTPVKYVEVISVSASTNPIINLCASACEATIRATSECRHASEVPALLSRCSRAATDAARWGRAMQHASSHLAFNLDGHDISMEVTNVHHRCVWLVRLYVDCVPAGPKVRNVKTERMGAATAPALDPALADSPTGWDNVPRTLWNVFHFLKNISREDELLAHFAEGVLLHGI